MVVQPVKPAVLIGLIRGAEALARGLLERADLDLIAYHDMAYHHLREKGIPVRRFLDFLSEDAKKAALANAHARGEAIRHTLRSGPLREAYGYGAAQWELLAGLVEGVQAKDLFAKMFLIDTLHFCFRETDLRLIIAPDEIARDTRPVLDAARRLGVASLHLLHGFPYGAINALNLSGLPIADVTAVYSQALKDIFARHTRHHPDRIAVTGNFEWDPLCRPPIPGMRERVCREFGLDPARPIITYGLTYHHCFSRIAAEHAGYARKITDAVLEAMTELSLRHPDWQFVLRPHPNDNEAHSTLPARAAEMGLGKVHIDQQTTAQACVSACDVLVCCQSNLGIEALFRGKPVVNCVLDEIAQPFFDEDMGRLFQEGDAVLHAWHAREIAPAIEAALCDEAARRDLLDRRTATLLRFNGFLDGQSTARVCELAVAMAANPAAYVCQTNRWPEYEAVLARLVPDDVRHVLVLGPDAAPLAQQVRECSPKAAVNHAAHPPADGKFDAVILQWPVKEQLRETMGQLADCVSEAGTLLLVAPATCTAGLARAGFVTDETSQAPGGATEDVLAIRARRRPVGPGPWAEKNNMRKEAARQANAEGEQLYAEGRLEEAACAFGAALSAWGGEAVYHTNLGTALYAMGETEKAWRQFQTALHHDPFDASARYNLRAIAPVVGRSEEAERLLAIFGADEDVPGD